MKLGLDPRKPTMLTLGVEEVVCYFEKGMLLVQLCACYISPRGGHATNSGHGVLPRVWQTGHATESASAAHLSGFLIYFKKPTPEKGVLFDYVRS
jgi:hypothetical protein